MEEIIKAYIERAYPQLSSGLCWPKYGQVTGIADPPKDGGLSDEFRPMYAVDVQLFNSQGEPDEEAPPLLGVPVSMPAGGTESGILSLPKEGTTVLVQFINGQPHRPVITAVLPLGLSLAKTGPGESIWQGGAGATQSCGMDGDWQRVTHGKISDNSYKREVQAFETKEQYRNSHKTVLENDTHTIAGNKEQSIVGKYTASVASDLTLTTASNLLLSAAQKLELVAGEDFSEVIKNRRSIKADKLYLGDLSNNAIELLYLLIRLNGELIDALNIHTHGGSKIDEPLMLQKTNNEAILSRIIPMVPELADNNGIPTPYQKQ